MRYNKNIRIFIALFLCCSVTMASDLTSLLNTTDVTGLLDVDLTTDVSAALLASIFGDFGGMLPTVTQGSGGLVSLLFGYFNKGLFMIAGMLVTYSAVLSTIKTSEDGKAMGERTPIAWSIFRPVLGTTILVPIYNGYSSLQTFLMWATISGIGLANSVWDVAINTFNVYGSLSGVTSSISSDSSTNYSEAQNLVQYMFNSQLCFYSARQNYAKGKVAQNGGKNVTEANYTGTTSCASATDPEAPCYNFNFSNYTLTYSNLPQGYSCGSYNFGYSTSDSSSQSPFNNAAPFDQETSDFWSSASSVLTGLAYSAFSSIDEIALSQFNGYYAITNDENSTSDDIENYFIGDDGQCKSSDDCAIANLLAPIVIMFQDSLDSALSVSPFTQTTEHNNQISNNGGWILAAASYYQLVANSGNTTNTLVVYPDRASLLSNIGLITVPRYVSQKNIDANSDFSTNNSSYAEVNIKLGDALGSVVLSSIPASAMSGLTLSYMPNENTFKMGNVQYSGVGTDLYKVVASEIYYAGVNMFNNTSINNNYKNNMTELVTATRGGIDNTSTTTSSADLSDSGARSFDLHHIPNKPMFFGGFDNALDTVTSMRNYAPFMRNNHYGKVIDAQINWFIAKMLMTWQTYFLTSNLKDPVTSVRDFGFEVVEQSGTFLIYMAIETFKDNMAMVVQYLIYYMLFVMLSGAAHLVANALFVVAKIVFTVLSGIFFLAPFAPVAYIGIMENAFPWGGIMVPLLSGAASAQVFLLQTVMVYTYLWLPILFGATVPLMTLGLVLSVYAPMIPFLIFLLSAINWIIAIIEAMVAAPVVALGIAHPVGHDVLGRAELCLMLIFAVMVRPAAMIFGFIFAVMICYVTFPMFNYIFLYFMQTFFANAILSIGGKGAAVSIFIALLLYCYVVLTFITQAFSMIYLVPNKIMRWIGVPVDRADEEQWLEEVKGGVEDAAGKLSKGATETPGGMTSGSDTMGVMQAGREEFSGASSMVSQEKGKKD